MPEKRENEARLADLLHRLADEEPELQKQLIAEMPVRVRRVIDECWPGWAHAGQLPHDTGGWRVWLLLAGRGYGKTRAGAEWLSELARADGNLRLALVGATVEDVRRVMVEGESGLIAVAHVDREPKWIPDKGEVQFENGAVAYVYSASNYERLRGAQHHFAWCDELAKWTYAEKCWDNLMLGLRLGQRPRVFVTTTPRSIPLIRRLLARQDTILKSGPTQMNRNLPADFIEMIEELYSGTRLGRQEVNGELIEDVAGALWKREVIEACRVVLRQDQDERFFKRVVIGVDPPASAHGDACGIVVVGLGRDDKAYVLADHSVEHASPEAWARAVAAAADQWRADKVVAEANNGGDMVISTLRAADVGMPVKKVHASRGKAARAEPVSALYDHGKAFHVGAFPELEDQMCGLVIGGGYEGPGRSPDRADALVWAMTELMLGKAASVPKISVF